MVTAMILWTGVAAFWQEQNAIVLSKEKALPDYIKYFFYQTRFEHQSGTFGRQNCK